MYEFWHVTYNLPEVSMTSPLSKCFGVRLVPTQQLTNKLETLRNKAPEEKDPEELPERISEISIEKLTQDFREALSRGNPSTLNNYLYAA